MSVQAQSNAQAKKDETQKDKAPALPAHVQLKKTVSGLEGFDAQAAALEPPPDWGPPVQAKGQPAGEVHAAAAQGITSGGGALPHLDQVQKSFGGHDVSGVQAHVGGAATDANKAMGAEAYATGNHVAFAGTPDLHTVAHEAAHVVQQRGGVSLSDGVGKSGDSYEQHADKVADAVVAGKSAEGLLDTMSGGGAGGGGATQHKAVQHKVIHGGAEMQKVQELLNKAGFDCGKPDGIAGPKTKAAIIAFQSSKGLKADGLVGDQTMSALEGAAGGGGAPAPGGGAPAPGGTSAKGGNTPAPAGDKPGPSTPAPGGGAPAPGGGGAKTPGEDKSKKDTEKVDVPDPGKGADAGGGAKAGGGAPPKSGPVDAGEKAKLEAAGKAALAALPATSGADAGKTPGNVGQGDIGGGEALPDWFMEIQNRLVATTAWGEAEENAQHAIRDYAMFIARQYAGPDGKVPDHIKAFFDYIGRGSKNDAAAKKGGYKGTSALTGAAGAKNWCAGAASQASAIGKKEGRQAVLDMLKARGLEPSSMPTIFFDNLAKLSGATKAQFFYGQNAYAEPLQPGDRVDYLFDRCQYGGHAVHVVADLGDAFLHVSGNTTPHSAVATGIAKRLKTPPPGFNLHKACNIESAETKAAATQHIAGLNFEGGKLTYMIQRLSDPYKALAELEAAAEDPAKLDAALKKLLLKKVPGGPQDAPAPKK